MPNYLPNPLSFLAKNNAHEATFRQTNPAEMCQPAFISSKQLRRKRTIVYYSTTSTAIIIII
jgi:hypothetical protein